MEDSENCLLIFGAVVGLYVWWRWYASFSFVKTLISPLRDRSLLLILPLICVGILLYVLRYASSFDVQTSGLYIGFYLVMGIAWVGFMTLFFPFWGITARDDVVERRNPAAAYVLLGALLGLTFCFSGGNIGDGPGWYAVVVSAGFATIAFFLLWLMLEILTRISQTVTIDRDLSAGLRLGGFLAAIGLIFGRAAAGDWHSVEQTFNDFVQHGWPVAALLGIALLIEAVSRPTEEQPNRTALVFGLFPAAVYIAGAVLVLQWAGPVVRGTLR